VAEVSSGQAVGTGLKDKEAGSFGVGGGVSGWDGAGGAHGRASACSFVEPHQLGV